MLSQLAHLFIALSLMLSANASVSAFSELRLPEARKHNCSSSLHRHSAPPEGRRQPAAAPKQSRSADVQILSFGP
jgi:hypothetical protein